MDMEAILEGTYKHDIYPKITAWHESDRIIADRGLEVIAFPDDDSDPDPNSATGMADLVLYAASMIQNRATGKIEADEEREKLEIRLQAVERAIAFVRSWYE